MRGKTLVGAGVLVLALTSGLGGSVQAAEAPIGKAAAGIHVSCPDGQKVVNVYSPWGTLSEDGASFDATESSVQLTCKDARTETTTGTITTVEEVLTFTGAGEQRTVCCPAGTTANGAGGEITGKFPHWKGDTTTVSIEPTSDKGGYLVTRNWGGERKNFTVRVTCEQAG